MNKVIKKQKSLKEKIKHEKASNKQEDKFEIDKFTFRGPMDDTELAFSIIQVLKSKPTGILIMADWDNDNGRFSYKTLRRLNERDNTNK